MWEGPDPSNWVRNARNISTPIMKIHIFEILDKAKPNNQNIRGLNLAAVKNMAVKVNKMPL
jgi:hypothetical protein